MGGKAFAYEGLNCGLIPSDVYEKVKQEALVALRAVFLHVCVPMQIPGKTDHGDVDFFVAQPLQPGSVCTFDRFDWNTAIIAVKSGLNTSYGKRGRKNPDCMYFAVHNPNEKDWWIQLGVKVCFTPELFEWQAFWLKYATLSKIIGSMLKPLGLTIDPVGLHIRVEDVENDKKSGSILQPGASIIWLSRNPKDILRIMKLDKRLLRDDFETEEEVYNYLASSWLFSPAHFAERQKDADFLRQLSGRASHWKIFITEWIPKHYPESNLQYDIQAWYDKQRADVREQVFLMFPDAAAQYYTKLSEQNKKREEYRLEEILIKAINAVKDEWRETIEKPRIMIKPGFEHFPARSEQPKFAPSEIKLEGSGPTEASQPWHVPLYYEPIKQKPPVEWKFTPPSSKMRDKAKLQCLARWTLFDPAHGTPYLQPTRREKGFVMQWSDATEAGATDDELVEYAKSMWWHIWLRQSYTNYVGKWKKRLEGDPTSLEDGKENLDPDKLSEKIAAVNLGMS